MVRPTGTGAFARELRRRNPDPAGRRWLFVPYDQLSDRIGPLSREDPADLGIVLVESPAKAARRPYHKQKLALVLANLRQFALEQAARGVAVRHVVSEGDYASAIARVLDEGGIEGPIRTMRAAERELREDLRPLIERGSVEEIPHEGWLTTAEQFRESTTPGLYRMDRFYRRVRRDTGLLMERGEPEGGKYSFDADNRRPWGGDPPAPDVPRFGTDAIKDEVGDLIERRYGGHPGRLDLDALPATREDAETLWTWALDRCLPWFGPFEDAMSTRSRGLFHTRISALMHLHRILPRRAVHDVAGSDAPLPSREGFVRQVLGWREFVRHVHAATDGFRDLPEGVAGLGADRPLPPVFWGGRPSGLACLDRVIDDVWAEGYGHHITRLMVLSNIATLLDVSPRELTDWFWVAYTDAYDWVVEPNVLGMGTFSVGALMTTKPYVSGAAYLDRMSDYCGTCAFDPKTTCPWTPLYWAFLARHAERLADLPRMRLPLASMARRSAPRRETDRRTFERVSAALGRGDRLAPDPPVS